MVLGLQNDYAATSASMYNEDTVTLTKAQLKAILEAVGQVGGLKLSEEGSKPPTHNGSSSSDQDFYSPSEDLPYTQQSNTVDENTHGFPSGESVLGVPSSQRTSQHASASSTNPSPVSKFQQKKEQWERERAESENWNPWGRPGAGAPRNNRRSVVMATVSPSSASEPMKHRSRGFSGYSCVTSDSLPASTASASRVPDFLKSSIPFGPNCDETDLDTGLEKKRLWLAELERQRDEQRSRRSQPSYEGDRWGYEEDPNGSGRNSGMNTPLSTVTTATRTHHRGQRSSLDPESESRMQEQRDRALEYRRSIEAQVEEKRRKQMEERERLRREEETEERRLEEERERLKLQYDREQKQIKEKEEREELKRLMMAAAVQRAREESEAEKRARKAQRLNTNPLSPRATPTRQFQPSRLSLREDPPQATVRSPEQVQGTVEHSGSRLSERRDFQHTATVHPIQSAANASGQSSNKMESLGTNPQPLADYSVQEISTQTDQPLKLPPEPSAYVANRLLTPSVWRSRQRAIAAQNAWGHHRDMTTQTEEPYYWDKRSRHHSSERGCSSADEQSSRNTSAASSKRGSVDKAGAHKKDTGARPMWGVNQPVKSFVKMTDRDPNHFIRKKTQEMRRQYWEREMASVRDMLAHTRARPQARVVPSTASAGEVSCPKASTSRTSDSSPKLERRKASPDSAFQFRRRAASDGSAKNSERDSAWSSAGSSLYTVSANSLGTTYTVSSCEGQLPALSRRWSNSSDQVQIPDREPDTSSLTQDQVFTGAGAEEEGSPDQRYYPGGRRKWHSQDSFSEPVSRHEETRSHTPPASFQRAGSKKHSNEPGALPPPVSQPRRKWSDQGSFDPAAAALGKHLGTDSDSEKGSPVPTDRVSDPGTSQDPLVNPKVVTSRPTPRQDRILQQLSTLRQGLLQKQREIESLVRQPASWTS